MTHSPSHRSSHFDTFRQSATKKSDIVRFRRASRVSSSIKYASRRYGLVAFLSIKKEGVCPIVPFSRSEHGESISRKDAGWAGGQGRSCDPRRNGAVIILERRTQSRGCPGGLFSELGRGAILARERKRQRGKKRERKRHAGELRRRAQLRLVFIYRIYRQNISADSHPKIVNPRCNNVTIT